MGNFGPSVTQNYASLYLRVCCKDFFSNLQHDRGKHVDKNHLSEISKENPFLGQMVNFGPTVVQNYASLYLRISPKDLSQERSLDLSLQHNRRQ